MNQDKKQRKARRLHALWTKKRNQARTLWVVAVLAFWLTLVILGVVYYLNDNLDLILASIALGLMLLGVWLKARYQVISRREPERPVTASGPADGENHQPGG